MLALKTSSCSSLPAAMLALAALCFGCEKKETLPPREPSFDVPVAPRPPPEAAALPHLNPEDPLYAQAVQAVTASHVVAVRREAGIIEVGWARNLASPAWRAGARERLRQARASTGQQLTPQELENQVDLYRDELIVRLLTSLDALGAPEAIAYAFEIAEAEAAPLKPRQAAMQLLMTHANTSDPNARARVAAAERRVALAEQREPAGAPPAGLDQKGEIQDAYRGLPSMAAGFRRCYNAGLSEDRTMRGSVQVVAKVGADGTVLSAEPSQVVGLSAKVVDCVVRRVVAGVFKPPEGGGATIAIPVKFSSE